MNKKLLFTAVLALLSVGAIAQQTVRQSMRSKEYVRENESLVRNYIDSLKTVRDSLKTQRTVSAESDLRIKRLFMPLTYYNDVISGAFQLDTTNTIGKALLHMYLRHPEWVETTEADLRKQQSNRVDVRRPIRHEVELVDRLAPVPLESEVAPIAVMIMKPNFWSYRGDYSLQIFQNYVSGNWYKGGESNYSALAALLMEANYNNKQKLKWENRLEMKYGLQSSRSDSLHSYKSTEDLLRLTSKFGLQADKKWYYTVQFIGYTQFTHSYKSNDPTLYAHFLAPLNINVSLGMDYAVDWISHKLKGNFHIAPLAYNMKYSQFRDIAKRIGISEGHFKHDFGSEFTVDLEWKFSDAVKWKTRLYGYTTFRRSELEWENTFVLTFNKYISAQLFIYPRFDDGVARDLHHAYWQFKELSSIGFQYSF